MHERVGLTGLKKRLDAEASQWAQILPQIPRLVYSNLNKPQTGPGLNLELLRLRKAQEHTNRLLTVLSAIAAVAVGVAIWALTRP
jgi:ubiquinone biosynthesis protein